MNVSHITLRTRHARRCMTLVCQWWSQRFPVRFNPEEAYVDFGGSSCRFKVLDDGLEVEVAGDAATLEELEVSVIAHLNRFVPLPSWPAMAWRRHA